MIIGKIFGFHRILGKSQGYLGLPVRDVTGADGEHMMETAWEPTPDELERLNNGGMVRMRIIAPPNCHPPCMLETETTLAMVGTNSGHGHVWARPDDEVKDCGGIAKCATCARDALMTKDDSDG